jgi:hypothetical protein
MPAAMTSSFDRDSAVDSLAGFFVVGPLQQSRDRNQGRSVAIAGGSPCEDGSRA